jgi:hypothetical protein
MQYNYWYIQGQEKKIISFAANSREEADDLAFAWLAGKEISGIGFNNEVMGNLDTIMYFLGITLPIAAIALLVVALR